MDNNEYNCIGDNMKKIILLILIFVFLTGCNRNISYIDTIVVENDDFLANINYPITNTGLDFTIKKDLKNIYNQYKDKRIELNIDYLYYKFNDMISVVLFIYINDSNHQQNYVKSYFYKDKLIPIDKFVNKELLNKLLIQKLKYDDLNKINVKYEFGFDNTNLYLYFNNINSYETITIPLKELNIHFEEDKNVINDLLVPNSSIDYNSKVIALTFDDGPSIYTDSIIEYLYNNDCKATFFVLGNKVNNYADVLNKSISYGNEIGNHSYNHKWLIKLKKEDMINQIEKTQNLIYQNTGYIPKLLRPTYGDVNNTLRSATNLNIALWNVDTMDWKYKSTNRIVSRATRNLKDENIILMHDIYKRTFESVKKIVPIIKKNGYKCVTISELNEIKKMRSVYD